MYNKYKNLKPGDLIFDIIDNEWGIVLKKYNTHSWNIYWSNIGLYETNFKYYEHIKERFEIYPI